MTERQRRRGHVRRETTETQIEVMLDLDAPLSAEQLTEAAEGPAIATGMGFFDHMLEQIARHGRIGLALRCAGDLHIDTHHSVEDCGIAIGQALDQALGERRGIGRYGSALIPLDEALVRVVVDLSGRPFVYSDCPLAVERIGDFETETLDEFLRALAVNARMTLHAEFLHGHNAHHLVEALFKGLGRALAEASAETGVAGEVPSTKGVL